MTYTLPTGTTGGVASYGGADPLGTGSSTYTTSGLTNVGASVDQRTINEETGSTPGAVTAFGFVLAWALVIFLLWLLTRTRTGYSIVYYLAWAALILLLLTQYRWVIGALAPISGVVVQPATPASS